MWEAGMQASVRSGDVTGASNPGHSYQRSVRVLTRGVCIYTHTPTIYAHMHALQGPSQAVEDKITSVF